METNDTLDQKTKAKQLMIHGYKLCTSGNYTDGAKYFKKAAALGNLEAVYGLAFLYYEGKGVEKDLAEATRCFETLANQECDFREVSQLRLAKLANISSGEGIGIVETMEHFNADFFAKQRNYPRLWKRALNGDWRAQKCIADTIYSDLYFRHLDTDGETMMRYYLNLAEHDNVGAQESLFFIYSRDQVGVGLGKKNLSEAIKWGMKAAQNGCVNVQALLANALLEGSFEGEPVEQDREKAILWLRNAAKKGYKKAMKKLAELGM